jgi:hypothetical protein
MIPFGPVISSLKTLVLPEGSIRYTVPFGASP